MQQTQEVADVDSPAGQEQSREEKRASAQKMASPSKRLIAFTTLMSNVLQIAPIAVVQFADFLTDVFVVLQFWELGDRTSATIGFGCMVLSILPVILGSTLLAASQFRRGNCRNGLVMALVGLLGPINLHTLVLGLEFAVSGARFQGTRTESKAVQAVQAAETARTEAQWHEEAVREKLNVPIKELQDEKSKRTEEEKRLELKLERLEEKSTKTRKKLDEKIRSKPAQWSSFEHINDKKEEKYKREKRVLEVEIERLDKEKEKVVEGQGDLKSKIQKIQDSLSKLQKKVQTAVDEVQNRNVDVERACDMFKEKEPELYELTRWSTDIHTLFLLSKAMESGMESLPLSVLSASILVSNNLDSEEYMVFLSSLGLSVLSMAYGFLGPCLAVQATSTSVEEIQKNRTEALHGHKLGIFLAILINTSWVVYSMALCYGSNALGVVRYILPATHLLLFFAAAILGILVPTIFYLLGSIIFLVFFCLALLVGTAVSSVLELIACFFASGDEPCSTFMTFLEQWSSFRRELIQRIKTCAFISLLMLPASVGIVSASLVCAATDLWRLVVPFEKRDEQIFGFVMKVDELTGVGVLGPTLRNTLRSFIFDYFPSLRRLYVLSMAVTTLAASFGPMTATACAVAAFADVFAATYLSALFDHEEVQAFGISAFVGPVQQCFCGLLQKPAGWFSWCFSHGGLRGETDADVDSKTGDAQPDRVTAHVVFDASTNGSDQEGADSDNRSISSRGSGQHIQPTAASLQQEAQTTSSGDGGGGGIPVPVLNTDWLLNIDIPFLVASTGGTEVSGPGRDTSIAGSLLEPIMMLLGDTNDHVGLGMGSMPGGGRAASHKTPGSKVQGKGSASEAKELAENDMTSAEKLEQDDFLDAISWHLQTALQAEATASSKKAKQLERLQSLVCQLQEQPESEMPEDWHTIIQDAVLAYMPTTDDSQADLEGSSELKLEKELKYLLPDEGEMEGGCDFPSYHTFSDDIEPQPLHVTSLQEALRKSTWGTVPSFFGKVAEGCDFTRSYRAETCDFFISHSWHDEGLRKVEMLREFLFAHKFLGRILVVFPLLAVFLIPLGFSLAATFGGFPPWLPSFTVTLVLAFFLLWYWLSIFGWVPGTLAPWCFSTTSVWLDKLCIDQTDNTTKAAGVASFKNVLHQSEGMVALISESYFSRMWCVYELAVFARHKPDKLLLLSLDWPSSLNFLNPWGESVSMQEKDKMIQQLQNFKCKSAKCFVPADRVKVLREVRENFGSEEDFDEFVNTKLPSVLEKSKMQYRNSLLRAASSAFELMFGG